MTLKDLFLYLSIMPITVKIPQKTKKKNVRRGRRRLIVSRRRSNKFRMFGNIPNHLAYIPAARTVRLIMNENRAYAPVAGSLSDYIYRWTNPYDAYQPAGGISALNFASMCNLYNHWTVKKASVKVTFNTTSANATFVCLATTAGTTAITNRPDAIMNQRRKYVIVPSDNRQKTLTMQFNPYKFFGKSFRLGSSLYRGSGNGTANPTENAYLHVVVGSHDGSTTVTGDYTIEMIMDTYFNEPINQDT